MQICRDRLCASVVLQEDVTAAAWRPASDLASGVYYWRVSSLQGVSVTDVVSKTWEFFVGRRSAPVDTSWGTTMDVNGDGFADIAVGSPYSGSNAGRVWIYIGRSYGVQSAPVNTISGPGGMFGYFGSSVTAAGDVNGDGYVDVAIGAPGELTDTGRVYVYLGSATGLVVPASVVLTGPGGPMGSFGSSVAGAGDVNGDGYADIVVGACDETNLGAAYVYFGSADGTRSTASNALIGPRDSGLFGSDVSGIGDVNGDRFEDVVIGAYNERNVTGASYVYLGSPGGLASSPSVSIGGPDGPGGSFGVSVAGAGDVDADGYADLVVGAPGAAVNFGRAYVYRGGAGGLGATAASVLNGGVSGGSFGLSVAGAADVDGDGYGEVIVGAPQTSSVGRVFVYAGSSSGLVTTAGRILSRSTSTDYFGYSVSSAGDANGDGRSDILIGAPEDNGSVGSAFVYWGAPSLGGLGAQQTIVDSMGVAGSLFGIVVSGSR